MKRQRSIRRARAACCALALASLLGVFGAGAAGANASGPTPERRLPQSMASAGDSITRAFDIDLAHVLRDSPQFSWSTGTEPKVNSEYDRLRARGADIGDRVYNDAKTGATMSALGGQLASAASQDVDYVTVLMGANDLCTRSAGQMTPTATFRAQFQQALDEFTRTDPHALVFVSSIPNLRQLWSVLHDNPAARAAWSLFGICQSMLGNSNTDDDRAAVDEREQADNAALAEVCAQHERCRFDQLAVYHYRFTAGDVSTGDFFHPSKRGQRALAEVAWRAGFFSG